MLGTPTWQVGPVQVADVLAKHVDPQLLQECARTLEHCALGPDAAKVRSSPPSIMAFSVQEYHTWW